MHCVLEESPSPGKKYSQLATKFNADRFEQIMQENLLCSFLDCSFLDITLEPGRAMFSEDMADRISGLLLLGPAFWTKRRSH